MAIAHPMGPKPAKQEEPFYPVSDGEPMAETNLHWNVSVYCVESLRHWYAARDDVYVAGDNFLYFEQGKPRSVVSPDCYVVFDVSSDLRDSYKTWEEGGHTPDVVLEITSKSTRSEDTGPKFQVYQNQLHVAEYFMFDPTADYIATRLRGYRLGANGYVSILPDANGRLYSEQLGLELAVEGNQLSFYDPQTGERLISGQEARRGLAQETQRAKQETQRANVEAQRAEQEARRANEEAQRAEHAEAENARLRAELAALRNEKA